MRTTTRRRALTRVLAMLALLAIVAGCHDDVDRVAPTGSDSEVGIEVSIGSTTAPQPVVTDTVATIPEGSTTITVLATGAPSTSTTTPSTTTATPVDARRNADVCTSAPRARDFVEQPVLQTHLGRADRVASIDVVGAEVFLVAVCSGPDLVALAQVEPDSYGYVVVREFATVDEVCSVADVGDFVAFAASECLGDPLGQECAQVEALDDNGAVADEVAAVGISCNEIDAVVRAVVAAEGGPNRTDEVTTGSLSCSISHQWYDASLVEFYTCVGPEVSASWWVYYGE